MNKYSVLYSVISIVTWGIISFFSINCVFSQTNREIPEDQHCDPSELKTISSHTWYWPKEKTDSMIRHAVPVATGGYEQHCRLICGGESSVKFIYSVQKGNWTYYYNNGKVMAKGDFLIKERMGEDNRGRKEIHYFAEKTGKWEYFNENGEPVKEKDIMDSIHKVLEELNQYNVAIDW